MSPNLFFFFTQWILRCSFIAPTDQTPPTPISACAQEVAPQNKNQPPNSWDIWDFYKVTYYEHRRLGNCVHAMHLHCCTSASHCTCWRVYHMINNAKCMFTIMTDTWKQAGSSLLPDEQTQFWLTMLDWFTSETINTSLNTPLCVRSCTSLVADWSRKSSTLWGISFICFLVLYAKYEATGSS